MIMSTILQRPAFFGDWTVCQDKETTKTTIRTNSVDAINQFNIFDWCIADCNGNKDVPCIYVPNRVYTLDTVVLKDTLEGLMPIPENMDGNCKFETVSKQTLIPSVTSGSFTCSAGCKKRGPPTSCSHYSSTAEYKTPTCPWYPDGELKGMGVGIRGAAAAIDFTIKAKSAFEYLDIRITDWPRQYTYIDGVQIGELDALGWAYGQGVGERVSYRLMGNNIVRIWGWPGGGDNGRWGPANTNVTVRVVFTLLGEYISKDLVWSGTFPRTERTVEVSYVGAGRRGNHR